MNKKSVSIRIQINVDSRVVIFSLDESNLTRILTVFKENLMK